RDDSGVISCVIMSLLSLAFAGHSEANPRSSRASPAHNRVSMTSEKTSHAWGIRVNAVCPGIISDSDGQRGGR
ncbi:MAG: hypothetical protein ACE5E4_12965, partial [Candidatus Binatia bacterium]